MSTARYPESGAVIWKVSISPEAAMVPWRVPNPPGESGIGRALAKVLAKSVEKEIV
jgi:hypothetical protein